MSRSAKEGVEADLLAADIECLNPETLRATLVSDVGNHCEVWRTSKRNPAVGEESPYTEFVIKYPVLHYSDTEVKLLTRQYRLLKEGLEEIIPDAVFFITRINGRRNVCVLARAVNIWFNIANPQNREEAIALLRNSPRALDQLKRFLEMAQTLRNADNPKLIDLFGLDNLVLDTNREIRYIDSFDVFFFEDMQHLFGQSDPELERKIDISLDRLEYLQQIREAAASSTEEL